jgi:hypothetical protein
MVSYVEMTAEYNTEILYETKTLPWIDNKIRNVHCSVEAVLWLPMEIPLIIIHCHIILPQLIKQLRDMLVSRII